MTVVEELENLIHRYKQGKVKDKRFIKLVIQIVTGVEE